MNPGRDEIPPCVGCLHFPCLKPPFHVDPSVDGLPIQNELIAMTHHATGQPPHTHPPLAKRTTQAPPTTAVATAHLPVPSIFLAGKHVGGYDGAAAGSSRRSQRSAEGPPRVWGAFPVVGQAWDRVREVVVSVKCTVQPFFQLGSIRYIIQLHYYSSSASTLTRAR